jgi:trk system potassium uptake protein TrkH
MNNMGPASAASARRRTNGAYSAFSKIILSLVMLIGRLEIYPILALFAPYAWRK